MEYLVDGKDSKNCVEKCQWKIISVCNEHNSQGSPLRIRLFLLVLLPKIFRDMYPFMVSVLLL